MSEVGLVSDSTCDLGPEWLAAHDIEMVPLRVIFGDETFLDWVDLRPEQFYAKLKASDVLPKTSQPTPADFLAVYRKLAEAGKTDIVVVTLAARLSGTFESATMAAADSPIPVRVVDSHSASQGTGLILKAAMAVRDAGGTAEQMEAAAVKAAADVHVYFVVESLEYLVKGGRAGRAQALAASVLNIKPVLHITPEGIIEPYKKMKGMRAAIEEIAERVKADSTQGEICVSMLTGQRPDLVEMMRNALQNSGADYEIESEGPVGSVIGTHTGPDLVGLAYHPKG